MEFIIKIIISNVITGLMAAGSAIFYNRLQITKIRSDFDNYKKYLDKSFEDYKEATNKTIDGLSNTSTITDLTKTVQDLKTEVAVLNNTISHFKDAKIIQQNISSLGQPGQH